MSASIVIEELISALEMVQRLTGYGGADAAAVLQAVDAGIRHVLAGARGEIDSAALLGQIQLIESTLQADDDNADKALRDRYLKT